MIGVHVQRFGRQSWRSLYWLAYLVAGFFIFWHHSGSSDEGLTLTAAWNVSRGLVPYRDFFEFYTPGSFYLLGGLFRMFGASYVMARIAALALLLSGGYALVLVSRDFLSRGRQLAVPFLWLALFAYYPLINHNTFSLIATAWAWAALSAAERRGHAAWYAAAGAASGVAVWMLQTKGAAVVAAAIIAMVLCYRTSWRRLGWYAAGLAASLAPFAFWPISMLFVTLVVFPLQHYSAVVAANFTFLALAFSAHGLAGLGLWLAPRAPRPVFALWWLGTLLYASTASLPDLHHVISNSFTTVPLVLWLGRRPLLRGNPERLVFAALPAAYLVALVMVVMRTVPAWLPAPHGLAAWLRLENPNIAALAAIVQQHVPPNGSVYAGPFIPGLYFESQRRNPTRFSHLLSGLHPPEFFAEARRDLEADPPLLAMMNYRLVEKFGYQRKNPVDEFFAANYRVLEQRGDLLILVPKIP